MSKFRIPPIPRNRLLAGLALSLAIGGWGLWWWMAGQILQQSIGAQFDQERRHGATVSLGEMSLSGFPFRVRCTVTDFAISRRDGSGWKGPGLTIEAPLWRVNLLSFGLLGRHEVRLPAETGFVPLIIGGGEGSVTLGGASGFTEARLNLSDIAASPPNEERAARLALFITAPVRLPATRTETAFTVVLSLDKMHVPLAGELPFGADIESLRLNTKLLGSAPANIDGASLAAWTREGGSLSLDSGSRLRWGPLGLDVTGPLGLDRDLRPVGTLAAEMSGYGRAIDLLAKTGWIKDKQGQTAKAVLNAMALRTEGGKLPAEPVVRLPVVMHGGYLHFGPFRLFQLPALATPP
ncbi:MAG: DUF2125 domain-containing protein [Rhodospirillaceae bacterium]